MRIGILGGSFNPIHFGHLVLAEQAKEKFKLDKVIFVPANISPHKTKAELADASHRYKMAALAIAGNPAFEISDFEIKSEGKSYSINTLREFKRRFGKKARLYFIAGSDSLKKLSTWKQVKEIFEISQFVVAKRPNFSLKKLPPKVRPFDAISVGISSSGIRKRIKKGLSIRYLVPERARRYILKNRLYKT